LGLRTWRRQLKGTSEYTKAKEVLKAVYKVGRAFRHIRSASIYEYEYPEEMRDSFGLKKRSMQELLTFIRVDGSFSTKLIGK
jgi:hypothetical protein